MRTGRRTQHDSLPSSLSHGRRRGSRIGSALLKLAPRNRQPELPPLRPATNEARAVVPTRPAKAVESNRRSHPRRESGCVVAVYCCGEGEIVPQQEIAWRLHAAPLKGMLVDVSMGGSAIVVPQPLTSGDQILVRLSNRALGDQLDVAARVLRCTPAGTNAWKAVLRFARNLPLEQVQRFGRQVSSTKLV